MADLDAAKLAGLLADADRLRVVSALVLGDTSLEAIASTTVVPLDRVANAVGRLAAAGLVIEGDDGTLVVVESAFAVAARDAAKQRPDTERDAFADVPDTDAKVLRSFVRDGRLTSIPVARNKRLVILEWLSQKFEPGRHYSEAAVNLVLGQIHADTAALRRYLVDEGFLDREDRKYWRSGGRVEP